MDPVDVAVIGGGVVGPAVARALAEAGMSVAWVEVALGSVPAEPARSGLLDPISAQDLAPPLLPLAREALARLREVAEELEEETGLGAGLVECGVLKPATRETLEELRSRAETLAEQGCCFLDRDAIGSLGPALDASIEGALHSPADARIDPSRLRRALLAFARSLGVVQVGAGAIGLATSERAVAGVVLEDQTLLPAGDVVLCPGVPAAALATWLDDPPPLETRRESSVTLEWAAPGFDTSLVSHGVALWSDGSRLVVGGAGDDPHLVEVASGLLAELGSPRVLRSMRCELGCSSDGMPRVGRIPGLQGAVLALGYGRTAPLFAVLTGDWISELLVSGALDPDLPNLSPYR